MKLLRALFAASVAAIGIGIMGLANAHAAGAGAVSYTQTIKGETDYSASTNPCTGASGTLIQTYNAVFHITTLADGELWGTFTQTGTVSFVPDSADQPSYSGHFTFWDGFNANEQNQTGTATFSARLTGTDGSVISLGEVSHFTVTPSGVTYSFDKPSTTCG